MIANRMSSVAFSPTIKIANKVKELKTNGKDVMDFTIGEPDFNTPEFIKDAGIEAINNNDTRYTLISGTIELRKAIVHKLKRDNNLDYNINEIIVTNGAKQSLFNAMFATLNKDDEVLIPTPAWVSYFDIVKMCDGTPISIPSTEENGFKIKASDVEKHITPKTKWIMFNSPSNPTGSVYNKEELIETIEVLKKYPNIYILVDDIYEYLCYDCNFYTIPSLTNDLSQRILLVNGVSKAYAMTGWRVGYCASKNKELIAAMNVIQSQSTASVCSVSQHASAIALMDDKREFLKGWIDEYKNRRDYCLERINNIPHISCIKPNGAFYLFINISKAIGMKVNGTLISNSEDFALLLLDKMQVGTVHGSAFEMEGYIRLSFVTDMKTLKTGFDRIEEFCNSLVE